MTESQETISVICADPGSPGEFHEMLTSLRTQTAIPWELLVVGETPAKLGTWPDERIRFIGEKSLGICERRNLGLERAKGEYITFLNGKDVLGVKAMERRVHVLQSRSATATYCRTEFTGPCLEPLDVGVSGRAVLTFEDAYRNPLPLSSIVGLRDAMRIARFDGASGEGADWEYLTRLLRSGVHIARSENCEILRRVGTAQEGSANSLQAELQCLRILDLIYSSDDGVPTPSPKWQTGLSEPDIKLIKTRRLAGLLTRQLLAEDFDNLTSTIDFVVASELKTNIDLKGVVKSAAAIQLACSIHAVRSHLNHRADRLTDLAKTSGLLERTPQLAIALARAGLPLADDRSLIPVSTRFTTSHLPKPREPIVGPFERGQARMREGDLVYALMTDRDRRPGRMIDVGAHIGGTLRQFCADGWIVTAFEPDPVNRAGLKRRARPHWNLEIDPRAVSDRTGEIVQLYTTDESSGASSLTAFTDGHTAAGTTETVSLRDALGRTWQGHVHVLKTDTEGHDLPALRGFPWEKDKPDVVLCEFENNKTKKLGYKTDDLADFLLSQGYDVFVSEWHPIVRYGIVHDFKTMYRFEPGAVSDDAWGNLIAVRSKEASHRIVEIARDGVGLDYSTLENETLPQVRSTGSPDTKVGRTSAMLSNLSEKAMTILGWYTTPSGLLFGLAVALLTISLLGFGPSRLLGLLGLGALALFVPSKFASQYNRLTKRLDAASRQLDEYRTVTNELASSERRSEEETAMNVMSAELKTLRIAAAAAIARGASSFVAPEHEDNQLGG